MAKSLKPCQSFQGTEKLTTCKLAKDNFGSVQMLLISQSRSHVAVISYVYTNLRENIFSS
jgi:hypothetical protein